MLYNYKINNSTNNIVNIYCYTKEWHFRLHRLPRDLASSIWSRSSYRIPSWPPLGSGLEEHRSHMKQLPCQHQRCLGVWEISQHGRSFSRGSGTCRYLRCAWRREWRIQWRCDGQCWWRYLLSRCLASRLTRRIRLLSLPSPSWELEQEAWWVVGFSAVHYASTKQPTFLLQSLSIFLKIINRSLISFSIIFILSKSGFNLRIFGG